MKPPIVQYGGKTCMLPHILRLLPSLENTALYCEPFCGGAALFFALHFPKNCRVWLNDTAGYLINFYSVLKHPILKLELIQRCESALWSESLYKIATRKWKEFKNDSVNEFGLLTDPVEKAWAFWVAMQLSFSRTLGSGFGFCSTDEGRDNPLTLTNSKKLLESAAKKLETVYLMSRDANKIIEMEMDNPKIFFYEDPPYPGTNQGHYGGYTFDDFGRLLEANEKIKGRFMLSCYETPGLKERIAANGWYFREVEVNLRAKKTKGEARGKRTEMIIINYPPPQRRLF